MYGPSCSPAVPSGRCTRTLRRLSMSLRAAASLNRNSALLEVGCEIQLGQIGKSGPLLGRESFLKGEECAEGKRIWGAIIPADLDGGLEADTNDRQDREPFRAQAGNERCLDQGGLAGS